MVEKTEREAAQKNIAENRKAFHDYHILETFEAGVALLGTEDRRNGGSAKKQSAVPPSVTTSLTYVRVCRTLRHAQGILPRRVRADGTFVRSRVGVGGA